LLYPYKQYTCTFLTYSARVAHSNKRDVELHLTAMH